MEDSDEMNLLNLNCPQFVDFTEVNRISEGDSFFDKLLDLEGKLNDCKTNIPARKTQTHVSNKTDSEKFKLKMHGATRKRSMSVSEIDNMKKPDAHKTYKFPSRKRTLSTGQSDLKKHRYPATPLCLKRAHKAKIIKTSEELELEKIAELQNQLAEHLKLNKKYLKKLGLQERSAVSTKAPLVRSKTDLKSILNEKRKAPTNVFVPSIKYENKSRINQITKKEATNENVSSQPDGLPSSKKVIVPNKSMQSKPKIPQKTADIKSKNIKTVGLCQNNGALSKNKGALTDNVVAKNSKPILFHNSKTLSNNKLVSYEDQDNNDSQISAKPVVPKIKSYYRKSENVSKHNKSCLPSNDKIKEKENIPLNSFRSVSESEILYDKEAQEVLKSVRGLKFTPKAPTTIPKPFHLNSYKHGKDKPNFNSSFRSGNEMPDEKQVGKVNKCEFKTFHQ